MKMWDCPNELTDKVKKQVSIGVRSHPAHIRWTSPRYRVPEKKKNDITYCKQVPNAPISRTKRESGEEGGKGCGVLENQLKRQLEPHLSEPEPEMMGGRSG